MERFEPGLDLGLLKLLPRFPSEGRKEGTLRGLRVASPNSRESTGDLIFARAASPVKAHGLMRASGTSISQKT